MIYQKLLVDTLIWRHGKENRASIPKMFKCRLVTHHVVLNGQELVIIMFVLDIKRQGNVFYAKNPFQIKRLKSGNENM